MGRLGKKSIGNVLNLICSSHTEIILYLLFNSLKERARAQRCARDAGHTQTHNKISQESIVGDIQSALSGFFSAAALNSLPWLLKLRGRSHIQFSRDIKNETKI